ncbi:MAG: hypothetical protein JKX98_02835 [Alcanivoracaceae bacterium]|nr:hypothetical protein [Alcanivoracaceae bacterium]
MNTPQSHVQRIRERNGIINVNINSQIKKYQKKLVLLSFSKEDVSSEYYSILDKIKFLRKGLLDGKLRTLSK